MHGPMNVKSEMQHPHCLNTLTMHGPMNVKSEMQHPHCLNTLTMHGPMNVKSEMQHPHYISDREFKSALPSGFDHQQFYSHFNGTGELCTNMIPVLT
jgi:hypothetical protein